MAQAIKAVSVRRGYDVTRYALNSFGGAGGQHACLVADALGMTTVLLHPFSGLLSAYGMGLAEVKATRQATLDGRWREGLDAHRGALATALAAACLDELERAGRRARPGPRAGGGASALRRLDTTFELPAYAAGLGAGWTIGAPR